MILFAFLSLAAVARASWWPWSSSDDPTSAPAPMVNATTCSGVTFSRADAWQCFIKMGDGRVEGHAKDGNLDLAEIAFGIKTHLTFVERALGPSAEGVMERCDTNKDGTVQAVEYEVNQNPPCIGTASDLCHVHGVCKREFPV